MRRHAPLLLLLAVSWFYQIVPAAAITQDALKAYQEAVTQERSGHLDNAERAIRKSISLDPDDPFNYTKLAALLTAQGKTAEAISVYRRACELNGTHDPMLAFSLGNLYEQTGDYRSALYYYERALKGNPLYRFGLLNTARTLVQLHQDDRALADYKAFLETYPEHYEGRRYLAKLLLASHHPKEAVEQFQFLREHFPNRFTDFLDLARSLNASGEHQQALTELSLAMGQPNNRPAVLEEIAHTQVALKQLDAAARAYDQAVAADPSRTDLLLEKAQLMADHHQWNDAQSAYQAYLSKQPGDRQAQAQLADVYISQQAYDNAIPLLKDLLSSPQSIDPAQSASIQQDLAYAYQMTGQLSEAIPIYESLLSQPLSPDIQLSVKKNLAIAYHQTKAYDKALPLYRELAQQSPTPELNRDLNQVLLALGDEASKAGNTQQALTYYQEANTHAPAGNLKPLIAQADLLARQGQWDAADRLYRQVLEKDPTQPEARLFEARQALRKNQPDQALVLLNGMKDSDVATTPDYKVLMGDVQQQLGAHQAALTAYEEAVTIKPDQARWWVAVGESAQQLNQTDKALQAYEKALALMPAGSTEQASVYYNIGVAQYQRKQWTDAQMAFIRANTVNPALLEAVYALGTAYEAAHHNAEAIRSYEQFIAAANRPVASTGMIPDDGMTNTTTTTRTDSDNNPTQPTTTKVDPGMLADAKARLARLKNPQALSSPLGKRGNTNRARSKTTVMH